MKPKKVYKALQGYKVDDKFRLTFEVGSSGTTGLIRKIVLEALNALALWHCDGTLKLSSDEDQILRELLATKIWGEDLHRSFEVTIGKVFAPVDFVEKFGSALTKLTRISS